MISYFYHNKGSFRIEEDSLTSVILDGLKYLPIEIFWRILKKSLIHDELPALSGEMEFIDFWPRWDATGTGNVRSVEPDVFIRFSEFDIIIEAKRNDKNQQNPQQMKNQIIAYYNEYEDERKDLYYIKLGGLWNKNREEKFPHKLENEDSSEVREVEVVIGKITWSGMLDTVIQERRTLKRTDISATNACVRVLDDMVKGFEMHGFYRKLWIKDLKESQLIHDSFPFMKMPVKSPLERKLRNLHSGNIQFTQTKFFDYAKR